MEAKTKKSTGLSVSGFDFVAATIEATATLEPQGWSIQGVLSIAEGLSFQDLSRFDGHDCFIESMEALAAIRDFIEGDLFVKDDEQALKLKLDFNKHLSLGLIDCPHDGERASRSFYLHSEEQRITPMLTAILRAFYGGLAVHWWDANPSGYASVKRRKLPAPPWERRVS